MAEVKGYRATAAFIFDSLDAAITRMMELARTTGWRSIELTTPTAKTFRVFISQDFTTLDDARAWIRSMAALSNFDSSAIYPR